MFSLPSIFSAIGSDDGVRQLLHALGSAEPPLRRGVVADVEVNHGPAVGGPSRVDLPRRAREQAGRVAAIIWRAALAAERFAYGLIPEPCLSS